MAFEKQLAGFKNAWRWPVALAFVLAYLLLDYVSYLKPYGTFGATPWNPQAGLSVALIFLGGVVYAPLALIIAGASDYILRSGPLGPGLELATSAALGTVYIAAGLFLQRAVPFDPRLRSARDAMTLIVVAGSAAMISALLYTVILSIGGELGRGDFERVAWRFFIGDFIGILVVSPVIFLALTVRPLPRPDDDWILQFIAIIAVLLIIFGYQDATAFQLFYLLFLPLLWIALRYGTVGTVLAHTIIQVGLVVGAEVRFGNAPGLAALQALMIALAVTGLIVGAVVTERQAASQRIREQQAALNSALRVRAAGEVAAAIAHEINQPLTAIKTYASVASNALKTENSGLASQALEKLTAQSDRAAVVIKSIRDLLRQGSHVPAAVDIAAELKDFHEVFGADFAAKGVQVSYSVPDDFPKIMVDSVQLRQAIYNLVQNGADAVASLAGPGNVTIDVMLRDGGDLAIAVRDDGPGFPPGFNTAEPSLFVTTKADGSGIGLSIARTIAEAHGGRLDIETSVRGACVKLILPMVKAGDEADSLHY